MAILAGEKATASRINDELGLSASDIQLTSGTTTSTAYTATLTGGTACGIAFTAPASGVVLIWNACWMNNSGGANATISTIRVKTGSSVGSGTDVLATSDDNSIVIWGTNATNSITMYRLTGLTAGSSYNVQQLFRVTAGTGTFLRKTLIIKPSL